MKQAKAAAMIIGSYHGSNDIDVFSSCLSCLFLSYGSKFNCDIVGVMFNSALESKNSVLLKIRQGEDLIVN